jgi:putative molybdopterin biosynthesis protein
LNRKLVTFEEAKRAVESQFKPANLGEEEAVLLEAYNRVLSQDVVAPFDIPAFGSARVAGYAVKAADTATATEDQAVTLTVAATLNIGETPTQTLAAGEAVEVQAGAVLPNGADAILPLEDCEREDTTLQVYIPAQTGNNIQPAGYDLKVGQTVLKKGQVLGSTEIGVLAALGFKYVKVLKIPMVTILTVSSEATELGKPLAPGKSFDLNGYSLSTAAMECGAKPVYFGVSPEDKTEAARLVNAAVAGSDLAIICTDNPDIAEIVDQLGKPGVEFNSIAAKPGKQTAAAFIGAKPVFIFPTNPSAAMLMYQLFARTLVQRLAGRPAAGVRTIPAIAGSRIFSAKGSRTFTLVQLAFDEQCRLIADPIETDGAVSSLASADGFVEIAENEQYIDANQQVSVQLLRGLAAKA